jgi:diadenylate cyclase
MAAGPEWPEVLVDAVCREEACPPQRRQTVEALVRLALELVHEGREGRRVGTLFVIGDADRIVPRSRSLILDPLAGHDRSLRRLDDRSFRETVKELAQLDGAFIVDEDGTFVSAARFIEVDLKAANALPAGLGARHAAALSISQEVDCIALVVSESSIVRVFVAGALRAEVAPELFAGDARASFGDAEVHELADVGVTVVIGR